MGTMISILWLLAYLVVAGIVFYLVLYVLNVLGVDIPPKVTQLLIVLFVIIAVIIILTQLAGVPGWRLGALSPLLLL